MKIEAKIEYRRSSFWGGLMMVGRFAVALGVPEERVLRIVAPLSGTVRMTCLGRKTVWRLRYRDGEAKLRKAAR